METVEKIERVERDRAYFRYVRHKAISRKKNICKHNFGFDWYKHDGQYSKGKIHCGCGLCKFGKRWKLPTFKEEKESERVKLLMEDYYREKE